MLSQRSTPPATDDQPPDGRTAIRFWVGTFGVFVTTSILGLGRYALVEEYNPRAQPGEGDHALG